MHGGSAQFSESALGLSSPAMAAKRLYESVSKNLTEELHRWGGLKQTGVSLRYMMEFGSRPTDKNLLISAQFLHKELPIRIARRVIELENLPYGLSEKPAVLKVKYIISTYLHCIARIAAPCLNTQCF